MGTVHQFPIQRNQTAVPAEELAHALRVAIDATVGADASFEAREVAALALTNDATRLFLERELLAIGRASSSGIGPCLMRSASVGPSTSSSTKALVPSDSSMPQMAAMLGWLRLARICASRVNRASRSGSAAKASGRIFRATWRPSCVSVA